MDDLNLGDFIDKDIVTHFKKNKKSYDVQRSKPTEEELQKAIEQTKKEFKAQYKSQWSKPINYREFYKDSTGADVILVLIPKRDPIYYIKQDGSQAPLHFAKCALIQADITIFFDESKVKLEKNTIYLLRGKANANYRNIDSKNKNDFTTEANYIKQKGVANLTDLDPSDYERRFSFNLYDIIIKGA